MNISDDQRFIDALRAVLRMEPLYRKLRVEPLTEQPWSYPEELGTLQFSDGGPRGKLGQYVKRLRERGRLNAPKPRYAGEGHMKRVR